MPHEVLPAPAAACPARKPSGDAKLSYVRAWSGSQAGQLFHSSVQAVISRRFKEPLMDFDPARPQDKDNMAS